MAATPEFKVYLPDGEYVAACKYPEEAGAVVALRGLPGTTIRWGHSKSATLWTEGEDGDGEAGESFDVVARLCYDRQASIRRRVGGVPLARWKR